MNIHRDTLRLVDEPLKQLGLLCRVFDELLSNRALWMITARCAAMLSRGLDLFVLLLGREQSELVAVDRLLEIRPVRSREGLFAL